MYPAPEGPNETAAQSQELDDTFLSSDPYGYFISRIGMLQAWAKESSSEEPGELEDPDAPSPLLSNIGRPDLAPIVQAVMRNERPLPPTRMVVSAQVAVDAFALRHHIAEALLRLFVVCSDRLLHVGAAAPLESVWAQMTDDKNFRVADLVKSVLKNGRALPPDGFAKLVLPPDFVVDDSSLADATRQVAVCAEWLQHAVALLRPAELDTNTAHNKVKHGLAVRGRSDLRVTFSTVGPDAEGNVPLSAFDDGVSWNIFEHPVLEFLARPRLPGNKSIQGLEATQLRLDYRAILAEAALLAYVHAALFHVVAYRHFAGGSGPSGLQPAPHPGLVGETPKPNHTGHQVGFRFPITEPPNGGSARPAGIGLPDGTFQTFQVTGERISGRIVEDDPPDS